MNSAAILAAIDSEIAKLQQARALLTETAVASKKGPGRPKGVKAAAPAATPTPTKRVLSAEARAKIAAAQKKRWASAKKSK